MRIVVDMQGAQSESRYREIGRYTNSFVHALLENRGDHEFILALNGLFPETIEPIRADFDGLISQRDIRVWYAPGPVKERIFGNAQRRRIAEMIREGFIQSLAPDVIHVTSLFEGYVDDAVTSIGRFDHRTPVCVTLHDLVPLLNERTHLEANAAYAHYYREKLQHLGRATLLLAISENSRREAIACLQWPEDRIVNIAAAADAYGAEPEQASLFSWDGCARRAMGAFGRIHSARDAGVKPVASDSVRAHLIEVVAAGIPASLTPHEVAPIARAISRIPRSGQPRQLFLDISELAQRDARTGIQRVTRSILNELLEHPPTDFVVEPVYATREAKGYRYAKAFVAGFRSALASREGDHPIEYHPGDVFLGLDLQHHVVHAQQEFLQGMRRDGIKVVFVVYDMLPILMPDCFPAGAAAGHEAWLRALTEFDGVVCISRAVADELKKWLAENPTHRMRAFDISWFRLGADLKNSMPTSGLPENADLVLERLGMRPTFLSVGTVEPRKGHAQMLAAFDLLWKGNVDANLAIVGKQGWQVDDLANRLRAHPKFGRQLLWLEGISDEYLQRVYAASTCLLAASEGEGFGLPLIEAAQHGLPIIARDIPVFREVAGAHAAYFSGKSPEVLALAIADWLQAHAANTHIVSKGIAWLTWKESASELVARAS